MFLANQIQYQLIFSHIMNIEESGHAARSKYTKYYKHKRASPYMELQARLHKFYKHLRVYTIMMMFIKTMLQSNGIKVPLLASL